MLFFAHWLILDYFCGSDATAKKLELSYSLIAPPYSYFLARAGIRT